MGPAKVVPVWEEHLLTLLRQSVWTSQEVGTLPLLHLTEEAKRCWMQVGRHCEWMAEREVPLMMKPHAKRFPQMVGRVAGVLHLIEGTAGLLTEEMIERASVIGEYFLEEAMRMLMPVPQVQLDARALECILYRRLGGGMDKDHLLFEADCLEIPKARAEKGLKLLEIEGRVRRSTGRGPTVVRLVAQHLISI